MNIIGKFFLIFFVISSVSLASLGIVSILNNMHIKGENICKEFGEITELEVRYSFDLGCFAKYKNEWIPRDKMPYLK